MLKKDLVDIVTNQMDDFLKKDVAEAVDIILETITESLEHGNRVEIRGFGSFSVRQRKGRSSKNPRTGKMMHIPPRKTVHFTMSKSLKNPLANK